MLAYRREGKGPPLLLIHGWGVRYTIWKSLAPLLRAHFTLFKIELPGLGGSPPVDPSQPYYPACADAIEELRRELGIERWGVLAYSSGTRAAEAYVQRYPHSVSRVIFLCPARLTELSSLGLRLAWWLDNTRPELTDWVLSDWRLYGFVRALGFNGRGHPYAMAWTSEIEEQPVESLKRQMFELPQRGRAPFELPPVPTLFIWGRRDALMARPRRAGPNHVSIAASHGAPLLAARDIAQVALPFLMRGEVVPDTTRWRRLSRRVRGAVSLSTLSNLSASEREELNRLRELLRRERDQFLQLLRSGPSARSRPPMPPSPSRPPWDTSPRQPQRAQRSPASHVRRRSRRRSPRVTSSRRAS